MEFSCSGRVWTEFGTEIFIFSFLAHLIPFWLKIMLERVFKIFEFFCYFFRNFLARVEHERNSGLNFFFISFLASLNPFWIEIMLELSFLIFCIFLLFFFNIQGLVGWEKNLGPNFFFFFSFLAYLIPLWRKIMPERGFSIFCIFLLFFSEFSYPGWLWTEFGTIFFFSQSRPPSTLFA